MPDFIDQPVNERAADGMTREEYAKKLAAEPQVMTFVAGEFEQFSKGNVVLTCATECVFGYSFHRSIWKELHAKHQWRDLAVAVMKVGYFNDLSYFLLGEAATGLGLKDAATNRTTRGRALRSRPTRVARALSILRGIRNC